MEQTRVPRTGPETLGARLERARSGRGLTQQDVGDHFGITSQAISQWEQDRTRPSTGRLRALADLFAVSLDWLLDGAEQAERPLLLPVIDVVQAGHWSEVADPYAAGAGGDYIAPDEPVSGQAFVLEIEGRSMTPEFEPGDRVIIDPVVPPRPGDFVVAKLDGEESATFKKYRLRRQDDRGREVIDLVPLNPDWPTLTLDESNPGRIVGTMVEHRRYRRGP